MFLEPSPLKRDPSSSKRLGKRHVEFKRDVGSTVSESAATQSLLPLNSESEKITRKESSDASSTARARASLDISDLLEKIDVLTHNMYENDVRVSRLRAELRDERERNTLAQDELRRVLSEEITSRRRTVSKINVTLDKLHSDSCDRDEALSSLATITDDRIIGLDASITKVANSFADQIVTLQNSIKSALRTLQVDLKGVSSRLDNSVDEYKRLYDLSRGQINQSAERCSTITSSLSVRLDKVCTLVDSLPGNIEDKYGELGSHISEETRRRCDTMQSMRASIDQLCRETEDRLLSALHEVRQSMRGLEERAEDVAKRETEAMRAEIMRTVQGKVEDGGRSLAVQFQQLLDNEVMGLHTAMDGAEKRFVGEAEALRREVQITDRKLSESAVMQVSLNSQIRSFRADLEADMSRRVSTIAADIEELKRTEVNSQVQVEMNNLQDRITVCERGVERVDGLVTDIEELKRTEVNSQVQVEMNNLQDRITVCERGVERVDGLVTDIEELKRTEVNSQVQVEMNNLQDRITVCERGVERVDGLVTDIEELKRTEVNSQVQVEMNNLQDRITVCERGVERVDGLVTDIEELKRTEVNSQVQVEMNNLQDRITVCERGVERVNRLVTDIRRPIETQKENFRAVFRYMEDVKGILEGLKDLRSESVSRQQAVEFALAMMNEHRNKLDCEVRKVLYEWTESQDVWTLEARLTVDRIVNAVVSNHIESVTGARNCESGLIDVERRGGTEEATNTAVVDRLKLEATADSKVPDIEDKIILLQENIEVKNTELMELICTGAETRKDRNMIAEELADTKAAYEECMMKSNDEIFALRSQLDTACKAESSLEKKISSLEIELKSVESVSAERWSDVIESQTELTRVKEEKKEKEEVDTVRDMDLVTALTDNDRLKRKLEIVDRRPDIKGQSEQRPEIGIDMVDCKTDALRRRPRCPDTSPEGERVNSSDDSTVDEPVYLTIPREGGDNQTWMECKDPRTGYFYYYNPDTDESQWTMPT